MNKKILTFFLLLLFAVNNIFSQPGRNLPIVTPLGKGKVNTRIDNMGYWTRMVRLGYVKPSITGPAVPGKFTTSLIFAPGLKPQNSSDVAVTNRTDVTQSENSVFIDPDSEEMVLNSNNSSNWIVGYAETPYGADALYTNDFGLTWDGTINGVPGNNSGDPATAIGLNGWWYVNKIRADYGQGVAISKDRGKTWKEVLVAGVAGSAFGLLDKNHLWIDNSTSSPFEGNLYCAWTNFVPGEPDTNQVQLSRSNDHGLTWSSPFNISAGVAAQKLNHGVNLQTGPGGEVYAVWSIYDSWPADENAIGFTKSVDGGGIFTPATRILNNIKGIRMSGTGKNMRVSSFPVMTVDISTGPYRGTVYIVWANIGVPGINTGSDINLYLIKSTDEGETWSVPVKVNQDPQGLGKQHYLPWITCDPVTGGLCVIYYDDRNLPSTKAETYVSYSYDGGVSWTDMKVSDYSFTPSPIPGLAYNYFGDYIGIQSRNMKVYPTWTDNHAPGGRAMTYVSPFDLGPAPGQPWVVYYSNALTAIPSGAPENLNFGDSLHLTLGLKNIGDQEVIGVTATIACASPYITFTDSVEDYGTLDSLQVKVIPNGYAFKVSDTIPDNLKVRFDVRVTSPDSAWNSHFSLLSHAPGLRIVNMVILDTLAGNRNGWLDPGETVRIRTANTNSGSFPCPNTYGILSVDPLYLTLQNDSVFMDTLVAPQVKYAFYTLSVSPDAPVGTGIDLRYDLFSNDYHTKKVFHQVIGQVTEDWETHTFTKFNWQQGGSLPWSLTAQNPYQGLYAAQSGRIYDSQSSFISLNYSSPADDSISFYYKTSSEQDYDFLMFYIDNVLQDQWSGEQPWRRASFAVAAGTHNFKWSYVKDLAYAYGQDRVWVDFIAFPPPVLPSVNAGTDATVCAGSAYTLQGVATGYDSLQWTTSGDGTFSNDSILSPVYTPGANDIIDGATYLKLTAWNEYGSFSARMKLILAPIPVAAISMIPNDTVCAGQSIVLMADTAGISAYLWTPGNFTTPVIHMDTTYHGTGTFKMKLQVSSIAGCTNVDSVYLTFRNCTGMETELNAFSCQVFPNPSGGMFSMVIRAPAAETISLSVTNASGIRIWNSDDILVSGKFTQRIDLKEEPDGIYLLTLRRAAGTMTQRLLLRR